MNRQPKVERGLFAIGVICLLVGCSDTTTPSPTGSLDVSVATAGSENDPDGFAILVDDLQRKSLPGAGRAVIAGLEPGRHTVELGGIAPTCEVTTDNPLSVEIQAGGSTSLTFEVSCTPPPPTGAIRVTISTTGSSLDPNGYGVWVDGKLADPVNIQGTLVVTGLDTGNHLVELLDIASECAETAGSIVTAVVTPPDTTIVMLSVVCTTPPPPPPTITVLVTTQPIFIGAPSSYTVILDGTQFQSVPSNGGTFFQTVPGPHSVRLRTPSNCTVGGFSGAPNPQVVTVSAGGRETVRFAVFCFPISAGS